MVTEIELKYSLLESKEVVTAEQVAVTIGQLLSKHKLVFVHQEKQLCNYYFDTKNLLLRKQRISLRSRGTKVFGTSECFEQTIKTSGTVIAGLHQRPEYNVDIENAKPIIALFPDTLWQPNTNINQLQQQIIELFTTNFTRHTWLVTLDNGQVEIAFDCGEIVCQGHVNKPRIYEIELELVSGDRQVLFALTKLLFSQLALRPGQLTKAARGYALYHESIYDSTYKSIADSNSEKKPDQPIDKTSLAIIDLSKGHELIAGFTNSVECSLNHIQKSVECYAGASSTAAKVNKLKSVCELLVQLQHVFCHFEGLLTADELALGEELNYFIQVFTDQLQITQDDYLNESKVLTLLHNERFNNLQLTLLSSLLNRKNNNNNNKHADEKE